MFIAGRKNLIQLVYGVQTSIRGLSHLPMQRTSQPSCEAHDQWNGMYRTAWRRPEKSLPLSLQLSPQYYTQNHLLIASFCSHSAHTKPLTITSCYYTKSCCHLTFSNFFTHKPFTITPLFCMLIHTKAVTVTSISLC